MIREFETSEFMATIVIERSKRLKQRKKGQLSFQRLFDISNRVMKDNPTIRITINSKSIEAFCSSMGIKYSQHIIVVDKTIDAIETKLSQYKPVDKVVEKAFVKANF